MQDNCPIRSYVFIVGPVAIFRLGAVGASLSSYFRTIRAASGHNRMSAIVRRHAGATPDKRGTAYELSNPPNSCCPWASGRQSTDLPTDSVNYLASTLALLTTRGMPTGRQVMVPTSSRDRCDAFAAAFQSTNNVRYKSQAFRLK